MPPDRPLSIAVLDDELHMRRALRRLLGTHGHEVQLFENGQELLTAQVGRHFDCIVLDLHMPGMDGFEVLESLKQHGAHAPVIMITGQDQPGNAERTTELGGCAYLLKPLHEATLLDAITRCTSDTVAPLEPGALHHSAISPASHTNQDSHR